MASSKILSVEVASEGGTYGSIDPGTGLPSTGGLNFTPMAFDLGGWSDGWAGEYAEDEDTSGHAGFFSNPPEVSAPWDSTGTKLDVRSGTITIHVDVRGFGAGYPAPFAGLTADNMPLAQILNSSMALGTDNPFTTHEYPVLSAADDVSVVVAAPGDGDWLPGEVVLAMVDSCLLANRIIKVEADNTDKKLTFLQPWPRPLDQTGDAIIRGLNFIVGQGSDSGARGPSVAVRLKTLRATATAFGCRLENVVFAASESGKITAQCELISPYILYEEHPSNQAIDEAPRAISAPAVTLRGTGLRVSGEKLAYEHDGWQLSINFGLERIGGGCAFGTLDLEPVAIEAEYTVTSRKLYGFDVRDRLDSVTRPVSAAASPHKVFGTPDYPTTGWGFNCPAAYLSAPRDNEVGGEVLSQTRVYKLAPYSGDASGLRNLVIFLGG